MASSNVFVFGLHVFVVCSFLLFDPFARFGFFVGWLISRTGFDETHCEFVAETNVFIVSPAEMYAAA